MAVPVATFFHALAATPALHSTGGSVHRGYAIIIRLRFLPEGQNRTLCEDYPTVQ